MNSKYIVFGILLSFVMNLFICSYSFSMDDPGFMINRMVMSENIIDREPVSTAETFSADQEEIYCFLEATEIEDDTTVSFVWYFENREMASVSLPIKQGRRWRTYSSKKTAGLKGNWKVELQESSGIVLNSVSFKVQ